MDVYVGYVDSDGNGVTFDGWVTICWNCLRSEDYVFVAFSVCLWLLVAWCSGNEFDPISEVTLRRARLALRWVTASGQVNHLGV